MYEFKRRIYEVLEVGSIGDISSQAYDRLMTIAIIVGLIPLTLKSASKYTIWIDLATSVIFLIDYVDVFILPTTKWATKIIELILLTCLHLWQSLICFLSYLFCV